MCDCISQLNASLKPYNTQINFLFFFKPPVHTRVKIAAEKIDPKVKGKTVDITPTYCPFCGEKYPEAA